MNPADLRNQIPALSDSIHLNTGTFGPSPTVVLDEIRGALDLIEKHGPYSPIVRQKVEQEGYEWTRAEAAKLIGATPDAIILTRSASDGINIIAHGLDWQPGDEVVVTDEEHQSGILPWLILSQRSGIKVRVASLHPDPAVFLQNFADQISPRTRLVFASHVSCISGIRLPVRDICQLAHENGALAVVDGAHALGQFPVDVGEIGCDAYVGSGHKWLLGPQGTGLAYIASEHLETFRPSWIGWGAQVEFTLNLASQSFALQDSARRFEFGTKQWVLFPGLGRAITFVDEIGIPTIRDRTRWLAGKLKRAVDNTPGLRRVTPMEPGLSTGIVSFELDERTPVNFRELLWQRHRLQVAYWHPRRLLRLSVAFFTTETEIDRALGAICATHAEVSGAG